MRTVQLPIFLTRKRPHHQHQRPERGHKSETRKRRPEGKPRKEAPILAFKLGLVFATRGSTWLQIWHQNLLRIFSYVGPLVIRFPNPLIQLENMTRPLGTWHQMANFVAQLIISFPEFHTSTEQNCISMQIITTCTL